MSNPQPDSSNGLPVYQADTSHGLVPALKKWQQPHLLPQLVAHWPLVKAAKHSNESAVEYLLRFDHNKEVDCFLLPHSANGRMFYNETLDGFNFQRQRLLLRSALHQILQYQHSLEPDSLYIGSTTVEACLPGLLAENSLAIDELDPLGTMWIGNKSRIAAHYDAPDNLICVTAGKRIVTLFPPEQVANLYIGPLHFTPAGQPISLVDFAKPDYGRFPRFAEAMKHAIQVELLPGDALFIPSMWWHHIEGCEPFNMLVNFWWRDTPAWLGRPENSLYHTLISLKSLPVSQRKAWQALFNHFVFAEDEQRFNHIPEHQQGPLGELDETQLRQFKAWLANNLKS